jgi:hypothetical protein
MKTAKLLIILSLAAFAAEAKPKNPGVMVITRNYDIFYFKVKRKLVGGEVKVFNDQNKLVAEKHIDRKQNIIDFYDAPPGEYTIKILVAEGERAFHYSKGRHISKLTVGEKILGISAKQ